MNLIHRLSSNLVHAGPCLVYVQNNAAKRSQGEVANHFVWTTVSFSPSLLKMVCIIKFYFLLTAHFLTYIIRRLAKCPWTCFLNCYDFRLRLVWADLTNIKRISISYTDPRRDPWLSRQNPLTFVGWYWFRFWRTSTALNFLSTQHKLSFSLYFF